MIHQKKQVKVYLRGREKPINEITWEDLCHPSCFVDYTQDQYIDWPASIKFKMRCAPMEIKQCLESERMGSESFNKKSMG